MRAAPQRRGALAVVCLPQTPGRPPPEPAPLHPDPRPDNGNPPPETPPAQATLSGVLTAGMFFFISNAKPLEQLSPTRPHPSIFNLYFFGSLLGQFAAQLAFLVFMYRCGDIA